MRASHVQVVQTIHHGSVQAHVKVCTDEPGSSHHETFEPIWQIGRKFMGAAANEIEAAEDRIRAAVQAGSRLDEARKAARYHALQSAPKAGGG